jgi:carnitine 3-dehydrogenase
MTQKAGIIGGGVIGGGWAARFLLNGWNVAVHDPDPEASEKVGEILANARAALPALSDGPLPPEGKLTFAATIAEAVRGAAYIQESVSERLDLKHRVLAEVQQFTHGVPIGSSTSEFTPSQLQENAADPATILVAHPFNPVYLLPLVEVVPSPRTAPDIIARAKAILTGIGMFPLHLRAETNAHIADRLCEALGREALSMVNDGIATAAEIDAAMRMSFGLTWGQMGLFETARMDGDAAGIRQVMSRSDPDPGHPRTQPTKVPDPDARRFDPIGSQSAAQSGPYPIRERERIRDQNLIGFLRVLKDRNWGAGRVLLAHDAARRQSLPQTASGAPLEMTRMTVLPGWIDYNGHMTESRYLFACSETTDAFLRHIGADIAYVGTGFSYYTAETHIIHLAEAKLGDALTGTVQVLHADEKRLHVFVRILRDFQPVATLEQMCLHVDMKAGKSAPAPQAILDRLMPIAAAHKALPWPKDAGRAIGQPRR